MSKFDQRMVNIAERYLDWGRRGDATNNGVSRVVVPKWQGTDVGDKPQGTTLEILNHTFELDVPRSPEALQALVKPNAWAVEHFRERVSGEPLNPPPSAERWAVKGVDEHRDAAGQFSHTYPERFWPKYGGDPEIDDGLVYERAIEADNPHHGLRYAYGDLADVVTHLAQNPHSRQAYLPVWFPEDTGVVHGERVPCTLGYHFIMRDFKLHVVYYIRSCDFMRHFRNDVYLAARLCQWVLAECKVADDPNGEDDTETGIWPYVEPGDLTMHITSFHIFEADLPILKHKGTP